MSEEIHSSSVDALQSVERALVSAREKDKFMVAIWSSEGDMVNMHTLTTWQFPVQDMSTAMSQLYARIEELTKPKIEPLPMASFAKPTVDWSDSRTEEN